MNRKAANLQKIEAFWLFHIFLMRWRVTVHLTHTSGWVVSKRIKRLRYWIIIKVQFTGNVIFSNFRMWFWWKLVILFEWASIYLLIVNQYNNIIHIKVKISKNISIVSSSAYFTKCLVCVILLEIYRKCVPSINISIEKHDVHWILSIFITSSEKEHRNEIYSIKSADRQISK